MREVLSQCHLFAGLDVENVARIERLATRRRLESGERLFELGSRADQVFVVLDGTVEICLPLSIQGSIREIAISSEGEGATLGWSAFVKPYRFRLSARAAVASSVATFERTALLDLIKDDPAFGCVVLERIAEIISKRLLTLQALWARELQRTISEGLRPSPH